jgi:hypothetical protein
MARVFYMVTAVLLASVGFGSPEAQAQRRAVGPLNTCQVLGTTMGSRICPRGTISVCLNRVQCTYRGRPATVCRNNTCVRPR